MPATEDRTYIHGTAPAEQDRLAALNRLTNAEFVRFLAVEPGLHVLEVGSGLGILAADVARAAPGVRVVALERSAVQLSAALAAPGVQHVQGDGHRLEFAEASFDLAYARYVLEHVADPGQVAREMRRVVRPGGRVAACENDVSLLRLDPPCPAFEAAWEAFQEHQQALGGDARIGRRLFRLLREAGFERVELSGQPELHWHGTAGFFGWLGNLAGNLESARQGLAAAGRCDASLLDAALRELDGLARQPQASCTFMWNRAMAWR